MYDGYRFPRKITFRALIGLAVIILIGIFGVLPAEAGPPFGTFYYPPGNEPPGPPPNYNQVDTSYFLGPPDLPLPPPDSGGIYIWVDSAGSWNVANHIYSRGNSLEQFHGSVLAMLDTVPTPGVNVFATNFEIFSDTVSNLCYKQNDRWGWYEWAQDLYEIWWDVSTREWKQGDGDPNDYMKIAITGCAIDFNVWSSGHEGDFGTDQIYLGGSMIRLSDVPNFEDTYPGIEDPYQSQAGSDPTRDPNITIFTTIDGIGGSYNKHGLIPIDQTYPCGKVLEVEYGERFSGTLVYEGNGVQFSSSCLSDPCVNNNPPVANSPNDTTLFVCGLDEICLPGFEYSDPDGNILSVEVIGGTLSGDMVCFIPVEGINILTLICTDVCGEADTAITEVTVILNDAPAAVCPNDTSMFVCDLDEICISGFNWSDPDDNLASVEVIGGSLSGNTVCFIPSPGDNIIKLICTDECGVADTCITIVTVILNSPPVASCPWGERCDTTLFVCDLSDICLPGFSCDDPDGNLATCEAIGGTLNGDSICFPPQVGMNYIKLIAADECGASDTCMVDIRIVLNSPPVTQSPNDTVMFVCDLGQICMPGFIYDDPDDNILSVELIGGDLSGDTACFTPVEGPNTLTLICTDECGAADTSVTEVMVNLNNPPWANSHGDTSIFQCNLDEICLDGFTYGDPDGNIISVDVPMGELNGDTICFTPTGAGIYELSLIVTDACGEQAMAVTEVTVTLNSPPEVDGCPNDTSVFFTCEPPEICVGPFSSHDIDGNLDSSYIVTNGFSGTFDDTTFCFTPNLPATYEVQYITVDSCGTADTCTVNIDVDMVNEAPIVECRDDTAIVICELGEERCLPGFSYGDSNDNIESIEVEGGHFSEDSLSICFTPEEGLNVIILTVTDSCGLVASCTTEVAATVNSPPTISGLHDTTLVVDDLSEICFDVVIEDPDDNIVSCDVIGGYLLGNEICFLPEIGINTITVICTDACGEADTASAEIIVGFCAYLPGDANADMSVNGLDITIMVNFFKFEWPLPDTCDCRPDLPIYPFFGAGDANGSCTFNGLDVTYLHNYFTGFVDTVLYCLDCPPTGGWTTVGRRGGEHPLMANPKSDVSRRNTNMK